MLLCLQSLLLDPCCPRRAVPTVEVSSAFVIDSDWQASITQLQHKVQQRIVEVYTGAVGGSGDGGGEAVAEYQRMMKEQTDAIALLRQQLEAATAAQTSLQAQRDEVRHNAFALLVVGCSSWLLCYRFKQATAQLQQLQTDKQHLQAQVVQLTATIASDRSEYEAAMQAAMERARADMEALMDVQQPSIGASPVKAPKPALETVSGVGASGVQSESTARAKSPETLEHSTSVTASEEPHCESV